MTRSQDKLVLKTFPQTVVWSTDVMHSFTALKVALCSAPALALPDYNLPFHLYVSEDGHTSVAVLAYKHRGRCGPTAYLSEMLPVVAQGMPVCLRALVTCTMMVQDANKKRKN